MPLHEKSSAETAVSEAAAAGRPHGVNLIGHVTAAMGLGVAARNTLAMLAASGRPFTAVDVDPGGGRQGADRSWSGAVASPPAAPHAVNWFQLNPPEAGKLVAGMPRWLDPAMHANVCVPFWELPRLPVTADWREWLGMMDLVLAPSRFILEAIRASLPDVPVVHSPQTVVLPAGVAARRADFGLPEDAILFHVVADGASDLERKNPVAAVRAFRAAFPDGGPVGLVIKLGGQRESRPWSDPAQLLAEAAGHPGIHVVRRDLDYAAALSLAASCDVCVSLHRSEGLGLGLLEAMSLGKPVIATAWSGSMDFATAEDCCLVGFDLAPVRAKHPAYDAGSIGAGQVWAEPRLPEAVHWMRTLATRGDLRSELGARCRRAAEALRARVLAGGVLEQVDRVAGKALRPERLGDRRRRWRRFALGAAARLATARLTRLVRRVTGGRVAW